MQPFYRTTTTSQATDGNLDKATVKEPASIATAGEIRLSQAVDNLTTQMMKRSKCLEERGQEGSWVPTRGYKYKGTGYLIKNGSEKTEIAPQTKWKWRDASCGMHTFSRKGFCNVMELFGYRRVFFVGDSITFMMANSFWWLLGENGDFGTKLGYGYMERRIECAVTVGEPFTFTLAMARNDNLGSLGEDDHHEDWVKHYSSNRAKTILIANTGAHTMIPDDYEGDMNAFVENVKGLDRPNDMTIYRTSVPGHTKCRRQKEPLALPEDYYGSSYFDQSYNWSHMGVFNRYSKDVVADRAAEGDNWLVLDVTPMTVLRPDGHKRPDVDCLHYKYPGPQDTWNHLLYSNLLEVAIEMQLLAMQTAQKDPFSLLRTPLGDELVRRVKRFES